MSNASGPLRKVSLDATSLRLPNDNEVNFWQGGFVNTEAQSDVNGSTPKTEYICGQVTGLTARLAKPGAMKALYDTLVKTTISDVDCVIEFANGDKFTASVYAVLDPTSFINNTDMKGTFEVHPRDGKWNPLN